MATFSYSSTTEQEALLERVEYRIDQVTADGQTPAINRADVYQELVEAMRELYRAAPAELVVVAASDGSGQTVRTEGDRSIVELPADTLRVVRLKLSDWNASVYELTPAGSPMHRLQANPYTRTNSYHPVAVRLADGTASSGEALACWPQAADLEALDYLEETAPEDVPDKLQDPLQWEGAARVLQAAKRYDEAQAASEKGASLLTPTD